MTNFQKLVDFLKRENAPDIHIEFEPYRGDRMQMSLQWGGCYEPVPQAPELDSNPKAPSFEPTERLKWADRRALSIVGRDIEEAATKALKHIEGMK